MIIKKSKYDQIMRYVFNEGRKQGRNELLRQIRAEQTGKGYIVGPDDYWAAINEAERLVK